MNFIVVSFPIQLVMKDLKVEEGKERAFGIRTLKASLPPSPINDRIKKFNFQILRSPIHGTLSKISDSNDVRFVE